MAYVSHREFLRTSRILTNATRPAFLGAVFAILAILTRITRVGTCTGRRKQVRYSVDVKNKYHDGDLSKRRKKSAFAHLSASEIELRTGPVRKMSHSYELVKSSSSALQALWVGRFLAMPR
jgi:hypothetical protein